MKVCNIPFNTLVHSPTGFQSCCVHSFPEKTNVSAEEHWNDDELREMRDSFIKGKPVGHCASCMELYEVLKDTPELSPTNFVITETGTHDDDLQFGEMLILDEQYKVDSKLNPTVVILNISNKCNLACRTCSPYLSDNQARYRKRLGFDVSNKYCKKLPIDIIDEVNSYSNVKEIILAGGEPMLDPVFIDALKLLRKDLRVRVQTNGTVYNDEFLTELYKFKELSIGFSIDGHKEVNEKLRVGVNQERMYSNIRRIIKRTMLLRDDARFSISSVLSNVTVFTMAELVSELESEFGTKVFGDRLFFYYNILTYPSYFKVTNLPRRERQLLLHKLNKDLTYFKSSMSPLATKHIGVINGVVKLLHKYEYCEKDYNKYLDFNSKYDLAIDIKEI